MLVLVKVMGLERAVEKVWVMASVEVNLLLAAVVNLTEVGPLYLFLEKTTCWLLATQKQVEVVAF